MGLESIVLAGGQVRRGGVGEALGIKGLVLAQRIAVALAPVSVRVTVMGETPLPSFEFIADKVAGQGPMVSLAEFVPRDEFVFIAACNLVAFRADIVTDLRNRIGTRRAITPTAQGRPQPLCALYRSEAFEVLASLVRRGERRLDAWLKSIDALEVAAESLSTPAACFNVSVPLTDRAAVRSSPRDEREPSSAKYRGF